MWFENDQIDAINNNQLNFRDFFKSAESGVIVENVEKFEPPQSYLIRSQEMRLTVQ